MAQELKELISSYQGMREGGRAPAICASIIETARSVNLDRDVKLPEENPSELSVDERDNVVGQVYQRYVSKLDCMCRSLFFQQVSTAAVVPGCNALAWMLVASTSCYLAGSGPRGQDAPHVKNKLQALAELPLQRARLLWQCMLLQSGARTTICEYTDGTR